MPIKPQKPHMPRVSPVMNICGSESIAIHLRNAPPSERQIRVLINPNYTLDGISVVLVAPPHNPAIINPDLLRNKGIVPAEWAILAPPISTPPLAHIVYKNGVSITADLGRCTFEEEVGGAAKDNYRVHEMAREYAKKLEYNYVSLGLNWHLTLYHAAPDNWLKNRFFLPGAWQENLKCTAVAFSIPAPDSAVCNFTLQMAQQQIQASIATPATIMLGCNFHFNLKEISEKTTRISDILRNWKDHQSFLGQALSKYFEKDLA